MPYADKEKQRKAQRNYATRKRRSQGIPEREPGENLTQGERREKRREFVRDLKNGPCVDCGGEFHFSAMDFDHVSGTKVQKISQMVKDLVPWETLLAEIAKCDLVCANCHRVRTWERLQT